MVAKWKELELFKAGAEQLPKSEESGECNTTMLDPIMLAVKCLEDPKAAGTPRWLDENGCNHLQICSDACNGGRDKSVTNTGVRGMNNNQFYEPFKEMNQV